jgi:hypothetical protein
VPPREIEVAALDGTRLPASVLDRDPATMWTSPRGIAPGAGLALTVPPRPLAALVVQVPLDATPLAVPWVAEVDGVVVARGPMRHTLQWINGAPRAGRQALLVVPLHDARGARVRLLFQGSGPPLGVGEVFLYGPDEAEQPAAGRAAAEAAFAAARAGDWDAAVRGYADAVRAEPGRASYHAALARAQWRARGRRHLDVESLDDGGPALVEKR